MSPAVQHLLAEALQLDEAERASLADALIESLHGPAEDGAEAAWDEVIRQRVRELADGTVETVPWPKVRARLFDGFE